MAESLYYKRTEDPNWNCITLSNQGGNWFSADISLKIFDLSGREISILISGKLTANNYQIPFTSISKGVYFYKLECKYLNETGKFLIVE